jgi:outer membrane biosynthesis protein TonB
VALFSLTFGAALIFKGAQVQELADTLGPVMVRLGRPEGSESPLASSILTSPPAKIPATTAAPAAAASAKPAAPPAKTVEVPSKAAPPSQPAAVAQPKTPAQPAAQSKPAASAPAAPAPEAPREGTAPSPASAEVGPVIAKGSEAGNSYSASVGGASGQVARSLYIPIYRYMPVPMYVEARVADKLLDPASGSFVPLAERSRLFREAYVKEGEVWRLKAPLPLPRREPLWSILEEAGYVAARADYKSGKVLSPVVLVFTVTPGVGYANPTLTDVKITQSCGYSDIDEAVLYGFRQAVFSSSAKTPATGKFTYRFDR